MLCVWDSAFAKSKVILKGDLPYGIQNVCLSWDEKMVAANSLDDNHTIAIYDIGAALKAQNDPKRKLPKLTRRGR